MIKLAILPLINELNSLSDHANLIILILLVLMTPNEQKYSIITIQKLHK